jgi:hypothetical protein
VVHDDHAVARGVDIQLDPVGAQLQRPDERRQRVLRTLARRAAMSDELGARRRSCR